MKNKIRTIVFDYGGTLDTDGIHWSECFWDSYQHFHIPVEKKDFRDAFVYSERTIINIIKPDFNLISTYNTQLYYQLEYLTNNRLLKGTDKVNINELSRYCYNLVKEKISVTRDILAHLVKNFNLGVISNYYGNVEVILKELEILKYFSAVLDSTVIGIRKPDKRIFSLALDRLNSLPEETMVVGDSYKNDIAPAKELGFTTVWLDVKRWSTPEDISGADIIIKSIKELPDILKEKEFKIQN
jgi:HAD superfamily hydrolase (TIGR01509 family)